MGPLLTGWRRTVAARKGQADARLEDFGWLLEELRVSLFAQELRTPMPVSIKRLEKRPCRPRSSANDDRSPETFRIRPCPAQLIPCERRPRQVIHRPTPP
jgi:hypothetical protein